MPGPIDEVGPWTEVKLEIVQEYASAYSRILASRYFFKPIYIDGFAGGGVHLSETSGEMISGTPVRVLAIRPEFHEYHFVERDSEKVGVLRSLIGRHPKVKIHAGDSNEVLLRDVLPSMTYKSYRKGLLFLDPYGIHVNWEVVRAAGRSRAIDLLLNFPIYDININVLKGDRSKVSSGHEQRMTSFWGDDSWKSLLYQPALFDGFEDKLDNERVVAAFADRLRKEAGFAEVSQAIPMKNSKGSTVYYLIGASQASLAVKVFNDVFRKWRKKGIRLG